MANQNELIRVLRMIPPKWALGIVGLLIGYWLLQPVANRTFGWKLPTLVAIVNNDYSSADAAKSAEKKESTKSDAVRESKPAVAGKMSKADVPLANNTSPVAKKANVPDTEVQATEKKTADTKAAEIKAKDKDNKATGSKSASTKVASSTSTLKTNANRETASSKSVTPKADVSPAYTQDSDDPPTYGYLKSIGRDRYESPEGLVYAPGSEEGHRLKHIARHTQDIPNRPGSHGVFEGDMAAFLELIDKGYRLASSKAKGTKTRDEDGLTVMEVSFDKKIGFVGGSEGRRKGTPSTKRLRIVVNGDRLITAFPF